MNDFLADSDIYSGSGLSAGIAEDQKPDIFNAGQNQSITPGETLFREGDPAVRCYFVQNGRLKLTKLHQEGKETIVRYINPGEITAAVAVFRGKRYPVTAVAVVPTVVIGWDRNTILRLLSAHPPLAINFLQAAVERLDDVQTRYLELQAERVERRIAHALLRIMRQSGRRMDSGILIDFPLSRQDLADYTGTTPYTVSRTLSRWEKSGWISTGREKVVVTDPHALVIFAENE
ncbi:Cyclic nucleotide-binding domain protein [uncultured Desulfatiglans sp.]|uniref:Cyclic nucleotide-binding domain protein n=1 Tax=Uncultured Desulfatiglans sp. TaxID=1748965 RepID=A0A653A4G6_UNCDX|nr:Cyclic nucleotide-binding domain protein [uncultured Desulfatiglans sp.]